MIDWLVWFNLFGINSTNASTKWLELRRLQIVSDLDVSNYPDPRK